MASDTLLDRIAGWQCPTDLFDDGMPFTRRLTAFIDEDGKEDGERINGVCECPECLAWWPIIETPSGWDSMPLKRSVTGSDGTEYEAGEILWKATMWEGHAECIDCETIMVTGVDGRMIRIF